MGTRRVLGSAKSFARRLRKWGRMGSSGQLGLSKYLAGWDHLTRPTGVAEREAAEKLSLFCWSLEAETTGRRHEDVSGQLQAHC